ncbi:MAG TPA: carboxypeptidase-like regulatory domain-containing protein [Rubricoccaceae bacterium]|nr:carboxypeptidase-like regulatory domain-containing protein [Rubricoccaceae bacterium]
MRLLFLLPALLLLTGCPLLADPDEPCICTEEYRMIIVRVVDEAGAPVGGLRVTVRNERTGRLIEREEMGFDPGTYTVVTDLHVPVISEDGDRISFHAENERYVADAEFVVRVDPCRCHIDMVSGPNWIRARPR